MSSAPDPRAVALGDAHALRETAPSRRRPRTTLKGRQPQAADLHAVQALVGPAPYRRDRLIEYLHALNDAHRCLREGHLVALAALMGVPMAEVIEVAGFYHRFQVLPDDAPAPGVALRVCDGLSCQLAGAEGLIEALPAALQAPLEAGRVQLLRAPCIGRCEHAPAALLGPLALDRATPASVQAALQQNTALPPVNTQKCATYFEASAMAPGAIESASAPCHTDYATYRAHGGYRLAGDVAAGRASPESVLAVLGDSGLRGLGGAGFPVGRKWAIVCAQPAPRLMAVNLDEGEPGTFKDRTYLERDPHRFIEGLLIAAHTVGCEAVYIYLRDEYAACRALLATALAALRADPPYRDAPLPRIELRRGAGAYICGEESAMIESLEGRRGEPRLRPPYIAQVGLFGRPTLEHNFESLYWVRDIVQRGAAWFSGFGRRGHQGLRSYSLSGRVRRPGVKLAPAGISVRELIDEFGGGMLPGHELYAYLPGGASGGILPARLAHLPLDFDTLQANGCFIGSAAVVVLSQHDRARDAALHTLRFFAAESCGQCTPCRVGTAKALALMAAPVWDRDTLDDLGQVMRDASICGLGQAAPNPIRCVQRYFAHEIDGSAA